MPILGAVRTQKYSSARISLEDAVVGNNGNPFVGTIDDWVSTRAFWFLLRLGGGGT
jgi:hypothetical protein